MQLHHPLHPLLEGDAFNSLFEMHPHLLYRPKYVPERLSILYLRCRLSDHRHLRLEEDTFNSLFEMRGAVAGLERPHRKRLSILYLRCPDTTMRLILAYVADLSILYLRCDFWRYADLVAEVRPLSILYLRCRAARAVLPAVHV